MVETASAPSGGAPSAAAAAPPTPSGADYSKSDSELIDAAMAPSDSSAEVPAEPVDAGEAIPETPEETPEALAGEVPEPEAALTPETPEIPAPEPAKAAVPSEADQLITELGLDDVPVPEARKALWKKDPASKDAFYRDLAYQRYGFTPKLAEAFYDKGITTAQDLENILHGKEVLSAFERDFAEGSEQGDARLIKSIFDASPDNARNLFRTAWKVLPVTDPDFAAEAKGELLDIALKQMAQEFKDDPDRSDLIKAFTGMLDEYASEAPKKLAPRIADRGLKAELDRYKQRDQANVLQFTQQTRDTANASASNAISALVAKVVAGKFPADYPLLNEVIGKVKDAVDSKLFQVGTLKDQLRAVLADNTLHPQQKAERYAALVSPVAERFIDREFARVSKPYTAHAITTNKAQLAKAKAVSSLREIGSGTAAPSRSAAPAIDYRKMSDEQIVEAQLRKR